VSQRLCDLNEVAALIQAGKPLLLAGDEGALRRLPRGKWIAGTIPYFMTDSGGLVERQRIFVNDLPDGLQCVGIRRYGVDDLPRIFAELPASGFGVMIAPAASPVHLAYALNAPGYPDFATRPLIGWIAGVHLSELGKAAPKVFDGTTGEPLDQHAVVMQISLPPGKMVELGILNIFQEGDGPTITFPSSGFTATKVDVDGRERNLAEFIKETGLDMRLPLVADYCGIPINVSFQSVDKAKGEVRFYAPVFAGVPYRLARPISDYVAEFVSQLPKGIAEKKMIFSCNCILNYLHSNLEGRKTGIAGPITFGEIAYQLLNQTMAYVTIESA
jgi:hypothetical protein